MRNIIICWVLLLAAALAGCGAVSAPPTPEPSPTPDTRLNIAVVLGNGTADDGGYNALSIAGISGVARRLGGNYDVFVPDEETPSDEHLRAAAETGSYGIIVTVSEVLQSATIATAQNHPDIHFIGIEQPQAETLPNLTGIIFPSDQAGFLAGVLAANLTTTGTVGGVYGPDEIEPIRAFAAGYENGVAHVDPDITVQTIFHPDGPAVGFGDIPWGQATANEQLDADVDVLFAAAGDTGRGALVGVANATRNSPRPLYCIGVDTDQWQTVPEARACLISSATKAIPEAVNEVIMQVVAGNAPAGNYLGPVSLAPFHDFDEDISDQLRAKLSQTAADLTTGALSTGYEG